MSKYLKNSLNDIFESWENDLTLESLNEDYRNIYESLIQLFEDKMPRPLANAYRNIDVDDTASEFQSRINSIEPNHRSFTAYGSSYHRSPAYKPDFDLGKATYDRLSAQEAINYLGLSCTYKDAAGRKVPWHVGDPITSDLTAKANDVDDTGSKLKYLRFVSGRNLIEFEYRPEKQEFFPIYRNSLNYNDIQRHGINDEVFTNVFKGKSRIDYVGKNAKGVLFSILISDYIYKTDEYDHPIVTKNLQDVTDKSANNDDEYDATFRLRLKANNIYDNLYKEKHLKKVIKAIFENIFNTDEFEKIKSKLKGNDLRELNKTLTYLQNYANTDNNLADNYDNAIRETNTIRNTISYFLNPEGTWENITSAENLLGFNSINTKIKNNEYFKKPLTDLYNYYVNRAGIDHDRDCIVTNAEINDVIDGIIDSETDDPRRNKLLKRRYELRFDVAKQYIPNGDKLAALANGAPTSKYYPYNHYMVSPSVPVSLNPDTGSHSHDIFATNDDIVGKGDKGGYKNILKLYQDLIKQISKKKKEVIAKRDKYNSIKQTRDYYETEDEYNIAVDRSKSLYDEAKTQYLDLIKQLDQSSKNMIKVYTKDIKIHDKNVKTEFKYLQTVYAKLYEIDKRIDRLDSLTLKEIVDIYGKDSSGSSIQDKIEKIKKTIESAFAKQKEIKAKIEASEALIKELQEKLELAKKELSDQKTNFEANEKTITNLTKSLDDLYTNTGEAEELAVREMYKDRKAISDMGKELQKQLTVHHNELTGDNRPLVKGGKKNMESNPDIKAFIGELNDFADEVIMSGAEEEASKKVVGDEIPDDIGEPEQEA